MAVFIDLDCRKIKVSDFNLGITPYTFANIVSKTWAVVDLEKTDFFSLYTSKNLSLNLSNLAILNVLTEFWAYKGLNFIKCNIFDDLV